MAEIWGILNVTPDSFSDGGKYFDPAAAIAHARRMRVQGADVIDIGGESTRPGATPIDAAEEQRRILPVVAELVREGMRVSVDTVHAATASAAIDAGATVINDVTGGLHDPELLRVIADSEATVVLMHSRGLDVRANTEYDEVVSDVAAALRVRVQAALLAGIPAERIMLDPGFGFSKDAHDNFALLGLLDEIALLGFPVLVGTSRKRFLRSVLAEGASDAMLDVATAASSLLAAQAGAAAVRVHDVAATAAALAVLRATDAAATSALERIEPPGGPEPRQFGTITLRGVEAYGYHGVFEHERVSGQTFVVDAEIEADVTLAAALGDLGASVHYGELAERIVAAVQRDPVDLIETLAARLLDVAFEFPATLCASITVHKPEAPIAVPFGDVSVTLTRHR